MPIDKILGQKVDAPKSYSPEILVREDRQHNRDTVGLDGYNLPFIGCDVWNCWEFSTLTKNGLPVSFIVKITYNAKSKYIVESKSLKLYLNSFNMFLHKSSNPKEVVTIVRRLIRKDLQNLLELSEPEMRVDTFSFNDYEKGVISQSQKNNYFVTLETDIPINLKFNTFNEDDSLLEVEEFSYEKEIRYHSSLLRSNCKVTHQPDWGDVYISIKGLKIPSKISLLNYIISFRNENHFHEEVCETIYKRLWDKFDPTSLQVYCKYTRRGGIDINPVRWSDPDCAWSIPTFAKDDIAFAKSPRQ